MPATSETVDTLRIATAGSVDDGKSTLIGRLLYDAKSILDDQLEHVEEASHAATGTGTSTWRCSPTACAPSASRASPSTSRTATSRPPPAFILADTPGHAQYTRNMVTGASIAEVSRSSTHATAWSSRRAARGCAALLGVGHVVLAVNKMDLVDWSEEVFDRIVADFDCFAAKIGLRAVAASR